jgi:hypothetical protein
VLMWAHHVAPLNVKRAVYLQATSMKRLGLGSTMACVFDFEICFASTVVLQVVRYRHRTLGVAGANTSVGVSPETFLQHPVVGRFPPLPWLATCSCCVIVIVITNHDSTSSRLLPGSSYSCCIRNLHALVYKQCHPGHITTAHEILQRRKWQLRKSTLPPNHSGSWTRKEKMGFVIHRKVVHSQSCTSLAAMPKPNQPLMPAKFHPQVVATEAEPSHAKHQRMWNAQPSTQIWMWSRFFAQRRGAKALHVNVLHCSTRMQELLPAAPSPKQIGLSYHVQVGRVALVHLLTTQYTKTLEKPGMDN